MKARLACEDATKVDHLILAPPNKSLRVLRKEYMIKDYTLDRQIGTKILELNRLERLAHEASGKLSGSILAWPLQWQILKIAGVEPKPFDEFTLRTFQRGKDVEDRIVGWTDNIVAKQLKGFYRDVICFVDIVVKYDGDIPQLKGLTLPHEVKSVTNAKFSRIVGTKTKPGNGADPQHKLQACHQALAIGSDYFAIDYVASDDLRVETYIYETKEYKAEVDKIIDEYNNALIEFQQTGKIPAFEARYSWQANPKYATYPDWIDQGETTIKDIKAIAIGSAMAETGWDGIEANKFMN